jgi:hypothetical protein
MNVTNIDLLSGKQFPRPISISRNGTLFHKRLAIPPLKFPVHLTPDCPGAMWRRTIFSTHRRTAEN